MLYRVIQAKLIQEPLFAHSAPSPSSDDVIYEQPLTSKQNMFNSHQKEPKVLPRQGRQGAACPSLSWSGALVKIRPGAIHVITKDHLHLHT